MWWFDVNMLDCFEISQIFTVESAEPEANTPILAWFSDKEITESVWLPYLNFLFWLENFLGFFDLVIIYPPNVN